MSVIEQIRKSFSGIRIRTTKKKTGSQPDPREKNRIRLDRQERKNTIQIRP